ncbi:MAG TPA: PLP-dependent aminotransferase family protein [Candidatus Polarisedimenticolia bacterium]|nr:PLP-dependent aminotransferase family protein [Candidatus Polarisedimenticolia bacterium]
MTGITLDKQSATPIYEQIARQLREAMESGRLAGEARLPTTRALASRLRVNRLTVARAYEELSREGRIAAHVGRGTFVAAGGAAGRRGPAALPGTLSWAALFARASDRAVQAGGAPGRPPARGAISFASVFPDPALFPVERFRSALDDVLRREGHRILAYGPPAGYPPLREMIAAGLRTRGMGVSADQVVITNGSQQGIDLVARALLDPGDCVLVENPTYTGAVQVFHSYGAEIAGVPVDSEGILVPQAEEAVERRRPKLVYVMPNFQNPTSGTMSLARRRAMVDLCAARRLPVLEDDFGGDLRFEGEDLPALRAMPGGQDVIYLSTFAKKLLPGLRIGWLAAPREMAERLERLKKITDYSTSLLLQAALHEFCRRGELDRHLAQVVQEYRRRRDAMLSAMKRCFPREVAWTRPLGGLVVWVTLPAGVDADMVARDAESKGVLVGRGDLFHLEGGARGNLRLTFSQAGARDIHRGIRVLGDVIQKSIRQRRTGPRGRAAEPLPLI